MSGVSWLTFASTSSAFPRSTLGSLPPTAGPDRPDVRRALRAEARRERAHAREHVAQRAGRRARRRRGPEHLAQRGDAVRDAGDDVLLNE